MYQDESFERMLKQKADEYRMYPSDNSWDAIQSKLRKKSYFNWKAAGFFTAVLVSLSLAVSIHQHRTSNTASLLNTNTASVVAAEMPGKQSTASTGIIRKRIINRTETSNSAAPVAVTTPAPVKDANNIIGEEKNSNADQQANSSQVLEPKPTTASAAETVITPVANETTSQSFAAVEKTTSLKMTDAVNYRLSSVTPEVVFAPAALTAINVNASELSTSTAVTTAETEESKTDADLNYEVHVPVLANLKPKKQIQFYITPSVSYRVLVAENKFTFGNLQQNPESAVQHRSGIGFEAGASFLFPVNNRLNFKAGLQFNYTSYIVTGSRFVPETVVTFTSAGSTLRTSTLRTSNGYFSENISNKTYQVSIPFGLDMRVADGRKLSLNIGATLQPTYKIYGTGYLVTNDLKNYVKAPDLLTNMNVNSGLEAFIRWKPGNFELQAGPQFRYQLFSNFKGKYPIQEHLVDYGFKIGFIKNLR